MNHPLDWQINYCLLTIEHLLDETEDAKAQLSSLTATRELTFEDKWKIKDTLLAIRSQIDILQDDIAQLEKTPTRKEKIIKRLMRK